MQAAWPAAAAAGYNFLEHEVFEPPVSALEDVYLASIHQWDDCPCAKGPFSSNIFAKLTPTDREHQFSRWMKRKFPLDGSGRWPTEYENSLPGLTHFDAFLRSLGSAASAMAATDAKWETMLSRADAVRARPQHLRGKRVLVFDPVTVTEEDTGRMIIDGMEARAVTVLGLHEKLPKLGKAPLLHRVAPCHAQPAHSVQPSIALSQFHPVPTASRPHPDLISSHPYLIPFALSTPTHPIRP